MLSFVMVFDIEKHRKLVDNKGFCIVRYVRRISFELGGK